MSIAKIYQLPTMIPGTVGVLPNQKSMVCGNTLEEVTTAGFLSRTSLEGYPVSTNDVLQVFYNYNQQTQVGDYATFTVEINNGVITLVQVGAASGGVILPVVDGNFAVFAGTDGTIADIGVSPTGPGFAKVVSFNDLGEPITEGDFAVFTDTDGSITNTGLSPTNSAFRKVTTFKDLENPISGNLAMFADDYGSIEDSAIIATDVQLKSSVIAGKANVTGGGAGPYIISVPGCLETSVLCVTLNQSELPVSLVRAFPANNEIVVGLNADPGTIGIISYIVYKIPQ
jgi:hypothetical protein